MIPLLKKLHLAVKTNAFNGRVENEHCTLKYYATATPQGVLKDMQKFNELMPSNLEYEMHHIWWAGMKECHGILVKGKLVDHLHMPHISCNEDTWNRTMYPVDINTDGLLTNEVVVGHKIAGEMVYLNQKEFSNVFGI